MKICNLNYLKTISPDPQFVINMVQLFLKNVPQSLKIMNSCLIDSEWHEMEHQAHKIKSHFDCMGIKKEFRDLVKQIEDYAKLQEQLHLIPGLLVEIEQLFLQASKELTEDLNKNYGKTQPI